MDGIVHGPRSSSCQCHQAGPHHVHQGRKYADTNTQKYKYTMSSISILIIRIQPKDEIVWILCFDWK